MARRCGCASDQCACEVIGGVGIVVDGAGSPRNPYIVTSTVADIETGIDIQYNNVDMIRDVHAIDFRGSAITITPGTDEAIVTVTVPDPVSGYSVPVGAIWMYGASVPPNGWLMCDGKPYLIADHPNLFAVLSNRYGGDGTTNFKVPNLIDRFPIGASATKVPSELGGGSEAKGIAEANLPPHAHTINHQHAAVNTSQDGVHDHELRSSANNGGGNTARRGDGSYATPRDPINSDGGHVHSVTVPAYAGGSGSVGSGTQLNIMPPWMAMAFIIKA